MQELFENFRKFVNEVNDNVEVQLSKLRAIDQKERNELSKYYKQVGKGKKFKRFHNPYTTIKKSCFLY